MMIVRAALGDVAIDAIATPAEGRRKRLLVADMDSTIVAGETLDELADFAGGRSLGRANAHATNPA